METLPERSEDVFIFMAQVLSRVELIREAGYTIGMLEDGQLVFLTPDEIAGNVSNETQKQLPF